MAAVAQLTGSLNAGLRKGILVAADSARVQALVRRHGMRLGASRFVAGETMPVVKDSASYLTDGEGVLGVGRTVDDGDQAATGPFCSKCGVRNDPDAKFCDSCGAPLAH